MTWSPWDSPFSLMRRSCLVGARPLLALLHLRLEDVTARDAELGVRAVPRRGTSTSLVVVVLDELAAPTAATASCSVRSAVPHSR